MDGPNKSKSDGFYNLLQKLVHKNVPIHGAGIQAHFNAGGVEGRQRVPTPFQVKKQIRRIGELGLKVNISEMDVRVSKLPEKDQTKAQCQIYHDIIAAALTEPAFDGVWLWVRIILNHKNIIFCLTSKLSLHTLILKGFSDRHTWVKNFYYDDSPLIFDETYQRKPAYYSFRNAIGTMAIGGTVGGGVILDKDHDEDGKCWGYEWAPERVDNEKDEKDENDENGTGDSRPDWLQP